MKGFRKFRRNWLWIGVPFFVLAVLISLYMSEWQRAFAWLIALAAYHSAYKAWALLHEIEDATHVLTNKEWDAYQNLVELIQSITRGKQKHGESNEDEVLY